MSVKPPKLEMLKNLCVHGCVCFRVHVKSAARLRRATDWKIKINNKDNKKQTQSNVRKNTFAYADADVLREVGLNRLPVPGVGRTFPDGVVWLVKCVSSTASVWV